MTTRKFPCGLLPTIRSQVSELNVDRDFSNALNELIDVYLPSVLLPLVKDFMNEQIVITYQEYHQSREGKHSQTV